MQIAYGTHLLIPNVSLRLDRGVYSLQMKLSSRLRITAVMAVAFTAEHADSMILSAMYLGIGEHWAHQIYPDGACKVFL